MNTNFRERSQYSFALISTLMIILVLTIIVVGFMTSVQAEKLNSRSYLNIYKAQLAAQSGLQVALDQLAGDPNGTTPNLRYFAGMTNHATAGNFITNLALFQVDTSGKISGTIELATAVTGNSTNYNLKPYPNEPSIIRPIGYVPITNSAGAEEARFAYWADDEGSKQNLNRWGGSGVAPLNAYNPVRTYVTNLSEMPFIQPNTNPFSSDDTTNIRSAHGPNSKTYFDNTANATAIPTVQTLNLIVPALGMKTNTPADVDNYTLESLSSYLTPEGYPKLSLADLKRLLDRNTKIFPGVGADSSLNFADLSQGANSPRVILVEELLNEDGKHNYSDKNSWGYGSLQYLKTAAIYTQPQQRQIVANILNYIDASHVPITDGSPGTGPTDAGSHPTFLGVKAWPIVVNGNTFIQGHPFINYLSPGCNMGKAVKGSYPNDGVYNDTLFALVGVINPWSAVCPSITYTTEVTAAISGNTSLPTSVVPVMTYFNASPLTAQIFSGSTLQPGKSYFQVGSSTYGTGLLGTAWNNNGPSNAKGGQVSFTSAFNVPVCRVITTDTGVLNATLNHRYLVQDASLQIAASPPKILYSWPNEGTATSYSYITWQSQWAKQGTTYLPYHSPTFKYFQDAYLVSDPRVIATGTANTWSGIDTQGVSTTPAATAEPTPNTPQDVFSSAPSTSDGRQNVTSDTTWYKDPAVTNHFPSYNQAYHPSPAIGSPPMVSVGEFGFIHTGLPWQTLHLQPDGTSKDYRILDYVKLGDTNNFPETYNNTVAERTNSPASSSMIYPAVGRVDGLVNVNTASPTALAALFTGLTNATPGGPAWTAGQASAVTNGIATSPNRPYAGIGEFLSDPNIISTAPLPGAALDFVKEDFVRRLANAVTVQSQNFTIYVVGENRFKGKTLGKVILRANVKFSEDATGTIKPVVVSTSYE